jgi:hypothetical protein
LKRLAAFLFLIAGAAVAQQTTPSEIWGSIYNSVFPTYADRQTAIWQGTVNGQLNVTGLGPVTPQFLLLVNGTSFVLQTDGVAKICLAGTC